MKNLKRVTIREVADRAGVSISTVSRALRHVGYVSNHTRNKITKAAKDLDFQIDKNARNLRTGHSHVIGVILHNHIDTDGKRHPFLSEMTVAITQQVVGYGYDALFLEQSTHDDWYKNESWFDDVESGFIDGFILLGGSTSHQSYLKRINDLNSNKVPFVEWLGTFSSNITHCGIGIDGRQAAYEAIQHLISLGRRRIAFLGLKDSGLNSEMDQRRLGYLDAMQKLSNVDFQTLSDLQVLMPYNKTNANTSFASAQEITQKLVDRDIGFDAIFALTDLMAMAAINTLRRNGLDVPNDIAVVGFDNISAADYFNPPLTTVSQDIFKGGATLVDKLIGIISGKPAMSMILPSRLVVRESCGAKLSGNT